MDLERPRKIRLNRYDPSVLLSENKAYALYNKFKYHPNKQQGYLDYGATARVKLTLEVFSKKWYAVKIINKKGFATCVAWTSRCFKLTTLNEVKILKELGLLQDFIAIKNKQYIIQKLSEGVSLGNFVNSLLDKVNNANSIAEQLDKIIISIVIQLMLAVKKLHAKNILHTDLHPGNILYDIKSDILSIIDYGEALFAKNGESWRSYRCGTPEFLAPEVKKYDCFYYKYSQASDWYAVGQIIKNLFLSNLTFISYLEVNTRFFLGDIAHSLTDQDPKKRMQHIDTYISELQELHRNALAVKKTAAQKDYSAYRHSIIFTGKAPIERVLPVIENTAGQVSDNYSKPQLLSACPKI